MIEEREKRKFIGYLYEAFFKYGFGVISKEDLSLFFGVNKEDVVKVLKEYKALKDLIFSYIDQEEKERENIKLGEKDYWIVDYLINLALIQGKHFRQSLRGEIKIIKGDLYEHGVSAGDYRNADLMFLNGKRLYVVEIKTDRTLDILKDLKRIVLNQENITYKDLAEYGAYLPFRLFTGVPIKLSVGKLTLKNFIDGLLNKENIFKDTVFHTLETITTLQPLAYAISYIRENRDILKQIDSIKVEVIHPFEKLYSPLILIERGENINFDEVYDRIRELYKDVRSKKSDDILQELLNKQDIRHIRLTIEEVHRRAKEELERRNNKTVRIQAEDISKVRLAVRQVVEDFITRRRQDKQLKVLGLFHSAGSGKTTSIRDMANKEDKVLVLYFASRKILVQRERDEYEKLGFKVYMPEEQDKVRKITENIKEESQRVIENIAPRHNVITKETIAGNLELIGTFLDNLLNENNCKIACFTTTQSIVSVNKQGTNTLRHIIEPINRYLERGFQVYIILDEFFGDDGGLYAIEQIFNTLYNKPAYLFLLDANVYSANLLEYVLKDYKQHNRNIQACVYALKFKEKHVFTYSALLDAEKVEVKNIECYTRHGFISTQGAVNIVEHFIVIESGGSQQEEYEKFLDEVYEIIKKVGEESEFSVLVFMQNKELGWELHRRLGQLGRSIALNTTFKSSEEEVNRQEDGKYVYKYIVSTSTASRGVSFRNVKDVVVIFTEHSIEENMVEIIQAISRGRGSAEVENQERYIHLVYKVNLAGLKRLRDKSYYLILPQSNKEYLDKYYEALLYLETLELADISRKMIQQFVNTPSEDKEVIVPVPTFLTSYYTGSQLDSIMRILQLINDVVITIEESGGNKFLTSINVRNMFSSPISIQVRNIKGRHIYIHPYLFDASMPYLSIRINKEKMQKAIRYVERLLKEYNRKDISKKIEDELRKLEELLNLSKGDALEIEEKFYVVVPTYTQVLMHHLKPGQSVKFALSGEIRGVETLGKVFSTVAEGKKFKEKTFSEPCIALIDKEVSEKYLEAFTQRVSPSFIYTILNKEG